LKLLVIFYRDEKLTFLPVPKKLLPSIIVYSLFGNKNYFP